MTAQKPIIHGRDHGPGGADPMLPMFPAGGDWTGIITGLPGLVGYWRLGEGASPYADTSGNTPAHDMARVAGTVAMTQNVTPGLLPPAQDDGAVAFNNTDPHTNGDRLQATAAEFDFSPNDPYTVLARIKPGSSPATFDGGVAGTMTNITGSPNWPGGWTLRVRWPAMTVGFARGSSSSSFVEAVSAPISPDVEYTVAGTYDGATVRVYVNGTLAGSAADAAALPSVSDLQIGAYVATSSTVAPFYGVIDEVAVWNVALTDAALAALHDAATGAGDEDLVLGIEEGGGLGWVQPKVDVTVNGEPPAGETTGPTPTPGPPPSGGPDGLSWIYDQPLVYGGSSFDVEPNRWTTIPFSDVVMVRYSNQTSRGGTSNIEIDWADPLAGGWVDPAFPHAITVPHEFPLFADLDSFWDGFSWMQVCLRLETPPVDELTTYRTLRVFETTNQKTIVSYGSWRNTATLEGGWMSVFRDVLAAGWTPPPDGTETFAEGDTGGLDTGNHSRIMFAPNHAHFTLNGSAWLPKDSSGRRVLTAGMRLVAQVWHDAPHALTFEAGGTTPSFGSPAHAPYRPHFCVFQQCLRSFGSPWSDWPTYP